MISGSTTALTSNKTFLSSGKTATINFVSNQSYATYGFKAHILAGIKH